MTSITTVHEIAERRGIKRVVHCHADHFEPEAVAKQLGAAADVALWLERCRPAIPTLFVKPPLGFHLDSKAEIGMSLRLSSNAEIDAGYLRTLVAGGVGVGLHVHHEAWTRNTMPREKLTPGQQELHDYAMRRPMDEARLRTMVTASLAWLRETTGLSLETWGFVHGCWAFGASDPEICQVQGELPLLFDLGCRADLSFPAGRRYCDPPWDRPRWILPATGTRACERSAADSRSNRGPDRMLVWASRTDAWWCGLDTYSRDSRTLTKSTDKIERYLAICPVSDGAAYIKTCSHGMHQYYWREGDPRPTVGLFATELASTCARAGVSVEFVTTEQAVAML